MKVILQFTLSVMLLALLYGFSELRREGRLGSDLRVELMNDTGSTLREAVVNKLLIQNEKAQLLTGGDKVVLKWIEREVGAIPSVHRVEAFRALTGQLVVQVWTREPVARIAASPSYLVDAEGVQLPLDNYRAVPLPLVSGDVSAERMEDMCTLIRVVQNDIFLKNHIIGYEVGKDGGFSMHARTVDYVIHLKNLDHLDRRIRNYKVFYQKAREESLLDMYSRVDLSCINQVVCTKKQTNGRS